MRVCPWSALSATATLVCWPALVVWDRLVDRPVRRSRHVSTIPGAPTIARLRVPDA